MNRDCLGDRMKALERDERFMPLLPIIIRADGKCFSSYTRGMERPFDQRLVDCMCETTRWLVENTGARVGYTQSDEITLVVYSSDYKTQVFFDGKVQKIVSVVASMATAKFNELARDIWPEKPLAMFDCRAWQVPTLYEATNAVLWREIDATKNSVSMLARCHFSHKQLHGKRASDMQDMLMERGVNWNDQPDHFKRGSYFQRRVSLRHLTAEEMERIPEPHRPAGPIERTDVVRVDVPPLSRVTNRVEFIFAGADPTGATDDTR